MLILLLSRICRLCYYLLQSSVTAKIFAYASLLINPEFYTVLFSPSFLSVLASFVHIEMTLSKYIEHRSIEVSDKENFDATKTGRRVRFCPFSSISPPTDVNFGSHLSQECCIEALQNAVEKVDSLCSMLDSADIERQRVLQCLEMLTLSLRNIEESSQHCLFMKSFTNVSNKKKNSVVADYNRLPWEDFFFPSAVLYCFLGRWERFYTH